MEANRASSGRLHVDRGARRVASRASMR
jgi:hypothetical protein